MLLNRNFGCWYNVLIIFKFDWFISDNRGSKIYNDRFRSFICFFFNKIIFWKKFNNVFENIYIVLDMDEWINKYIYLWLLCNICDLSVR